ncbi:MAG: HRDC domain-containing protein, partial [Verrucomicrobiota bacterium]
RSPSDRRIDYKEVLAPDDFAIFTRLREERKRLAEVEGVPVYAIFSNAQIAEMITSDCRTAEQLRGIEGIGEAKIGKYADAFLKILGQGKGGEE